MTTGGSRGRDRADLRDRHGELREDLEQERLELVVGPVELVDQQDGAGAGADRAQQRPLDEELRAVEVGDTISFLQPACVQELTRVVPLVERLRGVDALVALEPDQLGVEDAGERLRELGLADAGLALEQERTLHREREIDGAGKAVLGQVRVAPQSSLDLGHRAKPHGAIVRNRRCTSDAERHMIGA